MVLLGGRIAALITNGKSTPMNPNGKEIAMKFGLVHYNTPGNTLEEFLDYARETGCACHVAMGHVSGLSGRPDSISR